jgi:hypothetical protein
MSTSYTSTEFYIYGNSFNGMLPELPEGEIGSESPIAKKLEKYLVRPLITQIDAFILVS